MIDRQHVTTFGITTAAVATVALALWLKPWQTKQLVSPTPPGPGPIAAPLPAPDPAPVPKPVADSGSHRVDLVFAVDTTGSMGGLIDGAKRTVWSIASHVREVDPQADLRVGLVAYKDLGDVYVTRDYALSSDLDAVFAELSSYTAQGGGDTPEDVDAALYDAVHKMQWRDGAKKMIFLVGDAPPATRGDVQPFDQSARDAAGKQIVVNTIRCGADRDTQVAWQKIASLGHGEFSSIAEDGGVKQIATPYDEKMAEVSARIDATTVIYGDAAAHRGYEGKMGAAAAAPMAAKADRAAFYASKKSAARDDGDLVSKVAAGSASVDGLVSADLPADLRDKSKGELKAELEKRSVEREAAQKELGELAKQRAEYLRTHDKDSGGFDAKVKATVEHELK